MRPSVSACTRCILNQGQFPRPRPGLDLRFALEGAGTAVMDFPVGNNDGGAAARITAAFSRIVLPDPPGDIGGDAGVKRPVGAPQDVHIPHKY